MKNYKYIIIGGGTTAGYAAKEFAEQGIQKGELCIVSTESILPMNRPPFSKGYLRDGKNTEEILIKEKEFYLKNGIDVLLETTVKAVNFGHKKLDLGDGQVLGYEKLLIATGSQLKRLNIEGKDLDNVFYLRSIKQSDNIREQAAKAQEVVVVGGGYIGTETAASLNQMGLDVTLVLPEERLLSKFASADIAAFFQNAFEKKGVNLVFRESVIKFHGNEKVESVELTSGKMLETDMVVAGIGVRPNINIFENSGLNINKGIVVNEFCETNIENVYAAGDVVEFPDLIFGKIKIIQHWEHAFEQGPHAIRVMTGKREPYVFLPFFFSDVFEYSYEFFGDTEDADEVFNRGNLETGDFSTWWFKGDRLVAAFIMSSRPEEEGKLAREWITNKRDVDKVKIMDSGSEMNKLVVNTGLYENEF
ncbi:MAG: FAD-dependent oxidoreductase [Bacteroidales bacterium]|nr:FAD-dependent oxidoreductase [Bacteroidales bacterium]